MTGEHIDVADAGEDLRLPLVDILTGRGFVTGKSGSGKSTSVNVMVEEILDLGQPLLIVDTDGEYWGLKEQYQILHLGNGQQCDVRVTSTDAETIVDLALVERVPIILDISGFIHEEDAQDIVFRVVRELFHREKTLKEPFLLIVEEVHEYIPESGGLTDMGEMLIQVAKRGRKHGLGFCGVSQRPASVDKDFITQCDWIVWHRLTWKNDTEVVRTILGSDASGTIQELDPGEALLMTDWDEQVRTVQFRQKRTFDAGATPGFEEFDPPPLVPVDPAILNRFDERRQNVDYHDLDDPDAVDDPDADDDPDGLDDEAEAEAEPDADAGAPPGEAGREAEPGKEVIDSGEPDAAVEPGEDGGEADAMAADDPADEVEAAVEEPMTDASDPEPVAEPAVENDERPALRSDSVEETELVTNGAEGRAQARPRQPRSGARGGRGGRGGPAATPPASGGEGVLVEFAELVLFLLARARSTAAGAVASLVASIASTATWVEDRTALEDEDVVVALWLAVVLGAILLLTVALVGLS